MGFLTRQRLEAIGFRELGQHVLLSEHANVYNPGNISLGNHVRIDDFCVLSAGEGGIRLGDYIHIGCHCTLIGAGEIRLCNFVGLSARVSIFSSSDDFSGASMTNPMVPEDLRNVKSGSVVLGKHVVVGAGSVILPEVAIGTGSAVGALSVVTEDLPEFVIGLGAPARVVGKRFKRILELETELLVRNPEPKQPET